MPPSVQKDFDIAIIGGGVCGLACAIALALEGLSTHVYEAAATFSEIGAGIGIGPNAIQVLRSIGVWEDILAKIDVSAGPNRTGWIQFRSGQEDCKLIYDYPFAPAEEGVGMHRASLLDVFVNKLDPTITRCHMNKRCIQVLQSEPGSKLTICFADGTNASAHVVLGADGIKSVVRGAVTEDDPWQNISFSNTACYRGLVPSQEVREAGVQTDLVRRPVCFVGKDKINVVAFVSDRGHNPAVENSMPRTDCNSATVVQATSRELLSEYEGWGADVLGLLSCVQNPDKWFINVVYPPLKYYVRGSIALLGDAAHGMLPHLGAGAGQGLEDAFLLAKLLACPQTTLENVKDVLSVYDAVRRPRTQQVWDASRQAGEIYELAGGFDVTEIEELLKHLVGIADFVWLHKLEDEVEAAVRELQRRSVFITQ